MAWLMFDYECLFCGFCEEDLVKPAEKDAPRECPECGDPLQRVISVPLPTGILPSKPLRSESLGRSFQTNGEYREFLAKNPNLTPLGNSDKQWLDMKDRSQNRADAAARKLGYVDSQERGAVRKRERQKERELAGGRKPAPGT